MFSHAVLALSFVWITTAGTGATTDPGPASTPAPPPIVTPPPAAPQPAPGTQSAEISLEDWKRDDWMLLKPKLSLLEIDGYFRLRAAVLRSLDMGNGSVWEVDETGDPIVRHPANSDGSANFTGTNMRLRLEPHINVAEGVQVVTTIDVLDNVVLGSTPRAPHGESIAPIHVLSLSQQPMGDTITVKRLYGRVTALNDQLDFRFGRMPSHWGLGMLFNSGDCLDCDYDQSSDRVSLSLRMADHIFGLMYDWVGSGPTRQPFGSETGQELDAFTWDDVEQYSAQVLHVDHPNDIRDHVMQGETVLNYGMWNILRKHYRGLKSSLYPLETDMDGREGDPSLTEDGIEERRDATVYLGDAFVRLYQGSWELALEGALIYGSFKDTGLTTQSSDAGNTSGLDTTEILQLGAAMEFKYKLSGEYTGTVFGLKAGGASGDSHSGYGALDAAASQRGSDPSSGVLDNSLNNFQFSPNYHVDLLLFRQILGTITDAWYVRPEVSYTFDERISGSLAAIYSQAIFKRSTARCFSAGEDREPCSPDGKAGKLPMGLELNAHLAFTSDTNPEGGAFKTSIAGGILFPLGAFDLATDSTTESDTEFPWTVQAAIGVTF